MEISCWVLDFAEALFSGQYKRNRRETRNIINIAKKVRALKNKQKI